MTPLAVLRECIGSTVLVLSKENRQLSGRLEAFDADMNLVLSNASVRENISTQEDVTLRLAKALVNGSHILLVVPGDNI